MIHGDLDPIIMKPAKKRLIPWEAIVPTSGLMAHKCYLGDVEA